MPTYNSSTNPNETRKIHFSSIAGERPIPRPCVLPGLRARQIGMLTSAGGVGKSFLALRACIEMAAGLSILGGIWGEETEGGKPVAYISLEDDLEDIAIRVYDICDQLGIRDLNTLVRLERNLVICDAKFLTPHPDIPTGMILPTDGEGNSISPVLIVIDTLSRFLGEESDENSSAHMTAVFKAIEGHLRTYNAAALILHHISKAGMGAQQRDEDPAGGERGSSVITFNARAAWSLGCPSKKIAEQHGIAECDRWQYATLKQTKVNFGMPHQEQWFQKAAEGVPIPVGAPTGPPRSRERLDPRNLPSGEQSYPAPRPNRTPDRFLSAEF